MLSEQEKQIGRSTFENGRLSFPTPLSLERRPGRDGRGRPGWRQEPRDPLRGSPCRHAKPGAESIRSSCGRSRESPAGSCSPRSGARSTSVELPGVTAVPAAIKALDINQDGQRPADLQGLRRAAAGSGRKGRAAAAFTGSLGPLSTRHAGGREHHEPGRARVIVAQNTFARRVSLDADGHWNIKDQYNAGRNSARILGAAALDTDGDGTKEIVLLDQPSQVALVPRRSRTAFIGPAAAAGRLDQLHRHARGRPRSATAATTC